METTNKITSAKYKLNWHDVGKSLLLAIGTPVLVEIERIVNSGSIDINWKHMGIIALAACITYLIKNFFTPATVQIPVPDKVADESTLSKTAK